MTSTACGSGTPKTAVTTPPAPAPGLDPAPAPVAERPTPKAPDLRLPLLARPLDHQVDLWLEPGKADFRGDITMRVQVLTPTDVIWLNAEEITVDAAQITAGGQTMNVEARPVPKDFLAVLLPHEIGPGEISLHLVYRGKAHDGDGDGIYGAKEGGADYLFTQFESTDARSAYPCFDEPSYKVPWQITIHAPKDQVVLSNTPVEAESAEDGGWKAVRFKKTPPLPSYLTAFAVGPFDLVDAGKSKGGTPIRIVVPKGRGGEVAVPVETTGRILDLLEAYFGMPYPFEKLDIVAVAVFNAGAMENPGLVTYRQEIVLTKPEEMSVYKRKGYVSITAHELAHQWFGNYVTLAWWDDTWLNEAFASWMGDKITGAFAPEWDPDVRAVGSKSGIMGGDSIDSARAIRQPIKTRGDIGQAFDGITYSKGEAVLNMIEAWVGKEPFQKGVRGYMAKYAWKNATYDDFVGAIAEVAGSEAKKVFDTFVLQSGVPLVTVGVVCEKGATPRVELSQERYVPIGSNLDAARLWSVPVCVRWGLGKQSGSACTVLAEQKGELALPDAKACPDWVMPNQAGIGYYRMKPQGDVVERLLNKGQKALSLPERISLIGDLNALVRSGAVSIETTLGLVDAFAKDESPYVVSESAAIVGGIAEVVPAALEPAYRKFILKVYGARAKKLGFWPQAGEEDELKALRRTLVVLAANEGGEQTLIKEATQLAWKWLDDRKAVSPEMADAVLEIAAYHGDQKLFDRLLTAARAAKDRGERGRLLGALGSFTDPKLVEQALALVLSSDFELRDSMGLTRGAWRRPETRPIAYKFVSDNFDKIAEKLPAPFRRYMAFSFIAMCDDSVRPDIERRFKAKIEAFDGGDRMFAQSMEQLSQCAAGRRALVGGVTAFLEKRR
jgi:alanyl aminopeptidase